MRWCVHERGRWLCIMPVCACCLGGRCFGRGLGSLCACISKVPVAPMPHDHHHPFLHLHPHSWATETLHAHRSDPRPPPLPTPNHLEHGTTADVLWNAVQHYMRRWGVLHDGARELWGKQMLLWHSSAQEALCAALYMQRKYVFCYGGRECLVGWGHHMSRCDVCCWATRMGCDDKLYTCTHNNHVCAYPQSHNPTTPQPHNPTTSRPHKPTTLSLPTNPTFPSKVLPGWCRSSQALWPAVVLWPL